MQHAPFLFHSHQWLAQSGGHGAHKVRYINFLGATAAGAPWREQWRYKLKEVTKKITDGIADRRATYTTLVHHHHGGPGLKAFEPHAAALRAIHTAAGCLFTFVTVLREPISHAISTYYYMQDDKNEWYTWGEMLAGRSGPRGPRGPHLALDNSQTRYILNNHRLLKEAYPIGNAGNVTMRHVCEAARLISTMADLVGTTAGLDMFLKRLGVVVRHSSGWGGLAPANAPHENANRHAKPPAYVVPALTSKLAPDIALFDYFANGSTSPVQPVTLPPWQICNVTSKL